jgi:hypothetical protein
MSVTIDSIKRLVDRYRVFGRNPSQIDLGLIRDIARGVQQTGGEWDFDNERPVLSCFEGLTRLCWRFSINNAGGAATAYAYFVLENYNLWAHMPNGVERDNLRMGCHQITNTLEDWRIITRDIGPRNIIFQEAINVTSGMFGQGTTTSQTEALWNGRL